MEQAIQKLEEELNEIFTYLHQHPELSWEEENTTQFLAQQLEQEGYRVTTFDDCTGLVGEFGEGDLTVGLRADLDALWQEVDGTWQANHSCGHDAHMTIVLGVVKLLNRLGYKPPGKIKVLFQPAEEKGTGALKLVELGAADDLGVLYGVHLRPIQELVSGYAAPAIHNGAARIITGKIRGLAAHAARPHLGINVIEVGAGLVQELSKIHVDPQVPASVKMTRFTAGGKSGNIIPDSAEFTLDVRAQTNEVMDRLQERIEKVVQGLSVIYETEITLQLESRIAAAVKDADATAWLAQAITTVIGADKCATPVQTSGGDDFHFYKLKKPELKATMLGLGCDLQPGLHHPEMSFQQRDLFVGIQILAQAVMDTFAAQQGKGC